MLKDVWTLGCSFFLSRAGREPLLTEIGPHTGSSLPSSLSCFFFSFHFGIKDNKALGLVPGTPLLIEC